MFPRPEGQAPEDLVTGVVSSCEGSPRAGCRKTCWRGAKLTEILAMGYSTYWLALGLCFSTIHGFMAIFGDSMKSSTICNSYTLRWRGHVLPSRDRLPGVDDVGPDGTATAGRAM